MPSFNNLPAEIIHLILRFVGGDYLRAKADRLHVCKAWYEAARSAAFQHVTLTVETLQRFLAAPSGAHDLIRTRTRNLSILVRNFEKHFATILAADGTEAEGYQQSSEAFTSIENRMVDVCDSLNSFTTYLSRMKALKAFRIKMAVELRITKQAQNTWNKSLLTLISSLPDTLISLTIDNPGKMENIQGSIPDLSGVRHICPLLLSGDILPSLRHLRIRSRSICPEIFKLKDSKRKSRLETLIINLSVDKTEPFPLSQARHCEGSPHQRFSLYLHMLEAANDAKIHFPSLRVLRIYFHEDPARAICSWELISNKKGWPHGDIHWDDINWIDVGAIDLEFNAMRENSALVRRLDFGRPRDDLFTIEAVSARQKRKADRAAKFILLN